MKKQKQGDQLCCGYLSCSEYVVHSAKSLVSSDEVHFHGIPDLPKDKFIWGKVLGQGAFGRVIQITAKENNKDYAVKIMNSYDWPKQEFVYLKEEIQMLELMDNPSIPKFYGLFHVDHDIMLMMEMCQGIDLRVWMAQQRKMMEDDLVPIIDQLMKILTYVHDQGVVHCDLKPANIIVDDDQVLLIDFGVAQKRMITKVLTYAQGSPAYIAPEVWDGHYTEHADIWSVGIIVYECLVGCRPFDHMKARDWMRLIAAGYDKKHDKIERMHCSESAKDFCRNLLKLKPNQRLTAEEACTHKWLHDPQKFHIREAAIRAHGENYLVEALKPIVVASAVKMHNLLDERFAKLVDEMDHEHDYLSLNFFKKFFKDFVDGSHLHWNTTDIEDLFDELVHDHGGKMLPKDEFLKWYIWNHTVADDERFWACLEELDEEHDGTISRDNIKHKFGADKKIMAIFDKLFGKREKMSIRRMGAKTLLEMEYTQKAARDDKEETSDVYSFQNITEAARIEASIVL